LGAFVRARAGGARTILPNEERKNKIARAKNSGGAAGGPLRQSVSEARGAAPEQASRAKRGELTH